MRNDVMKVSRYHKLVEVINREIGILNGNMGVRGYEMKKGDEKKVIEKETKEESLRENLKSKEKSLINFLGFSKDESVRALAKK